MEEMKHLGRSRLEDMLTPFDDDRQSNAATVEIHDCRTYVNRTGKCRKVVVTNSDETTWVFDPMHQGYTLFRISFCPYCGCALTP